VAALGELDEDPGPDSPGTQIPAEGIVAAKELLSGVTQALYTQPGHGYPRVLPYTDEPKKRSGAYLVGGNRRERNHKGSFGWSF
jgi:hypothetical protein